MKKRVLCWLLCLCMVTAVLPGAVWANEGDVPAGSAGQPTEETPVQDPVPPVSEQPTTEAATEAQEGQPLADVDTSGLTVAKAMVEEGSSERVPAAERQTTVNMNVGESGGYFFFYNGVQLDDLLNESAPKLTATGSAGVSPKRNVTSWCYIDANSVGQGAITYTNGTDTGSITLQVSPIPFAFYDSNGADVMNSKEHMVDTIDWTPGQESVVLYALLGDPTVTVGELTHAKLDEEGNDVRGLTFYTETLTENDQTIGYKVTLTEVKNYVELHLTVPVNGVNQVARVNINYQGEDAGDGGDGPAIPDEPEVETVPAYDSDYAYGTNDANYSCDGFMNTEEAAGEPYLLYRSPIDLGENGNLPLKQTGMSAYAADRTYYLFGGTKTLDENAVVTVKDGGTAVAMKTGGQTCFQVTFPCIPRADKLSLEVQNPGEEDPTKIQIDQVRPQKEICATITAGDETYYVGALSVQGESQVTLNEGPILTQTVGESKSFEIPVGVMEKTEENGMEKYTWLRPLDEELKVLSAELHSYVNGVLTPIDQNDPYMKQLHRAGNTLYFESKETAASSAYYVLITFSYDNGAPQTFYMPLTLRVALSDSIDLNEKASFDLVDTNGDDKISLEELHALFERINDMSADQVEVTLPENNDLRGTLVLDTNKPVLLDGNGNRLDGSIHVTEPGVQYEVSDLRCYSVTEGIEDAADVGVYGVGYVVLSDCQFNGYHTAVESFKFDEQYDNGKNGENRHASYQKQVSGCLIAGCKVGILIDQHYVPDWYSWQYGYNTFYENETAILLIDLAPVENVIHLPRFRSSAFINNATDLKIGDAVTQKVVFYRSGFYTCTETPPTAAAGAPDADLLATLTELTAGDLAVTVCKINNVTGNDPAINDYAIIAPQSGALDIHSGKIDCESGALIAYGATASADNSETDPFSVENFTGILDMQQPDGDTYDHVATWDFSKKEDEAQ